MGDVKSKLQTYETRDLRKLVTDSNKKRRAEVMAEIKGMREQARDIINRKKQALFFLILNLVRFGAFGL